jgi:hypothetical protein
MIKLRSAFLFLALAASAVAVADPAALPDRILRLGYVEGAVEYQPAAVANVAAPARAGKNSLPASPLVPGDVLSTGADGRAELSLGTASIRLAPDTRLAVDALDESTVRLALERGTANLMVRELAEDETLAIATPGTTVTLREPGEYRLDVTSDLATDISVRHGVAEMESAGGPVRIADGQRALLAGADAYASLIAPRPTDGFDEWVLDREVQLADAAPPPPQYDDAGQPDYAALDDYGEWVDEPSYGRVWMPSYAYGGYTPFSYGSWTHTSYGGYSWYDSMPWGYYTGYGYGGRWAYLHDRNRWCWVPPRRGHGHGHGSGPDHRPPREVAGNTYTAPYRIPRAGDPRRVNNGAANPEPEPNPAMPRAFEGRPTSPGGVVVAKPAIPTRTAPTRTTPTRVTPTRVTPTPVTPTRAAPAPAPRSAPMGGSTSSASKARSAARSSSSGSSQSQAVSSAAQKGVAPRQDP